MPFASIASYLSGFYFTSIFDNAQMNRTVFELVITLNRSYFSDKLIIHEMELVTIHLLRFLIASVSN